MNETAPISEAASPVEKRAQPEGVRAEGYYGLPMLKRPLWGWEIALYFASAGISSGSFVLASVADVFGGQRHNRLVRNARYLAFLTLLPCPPLLIADLGRPGRFHHMLRIFKLRSPMSVGAWALFAYSIPATLVALAELAGVQGLVVRVLGALGLPLALYLIAYPGVLLTTTSIPIWSRTRYLGSLLGLSSMASAAGALSMVSALDSKSEDRSLGALRGIELAAKTGEILAVAAYVCTVGPAGEPLKTGRYSRMFRQGAVLAGMVAPVVLSASRRRHHRGLALLSGALSIAGTLALKWAVVHAGKDSAEDPAAYRGFTHAKSKKDGWKAPSSVRTGAGGAMRTNLVDAR